MSNNEALDTDAVRRLARMIKTSADDRTLPPRDRPDASLIPLIVQLCDEVDRLRATIAEARRPGDLVADQT